MTAMDYETLRQFADSWALLALTLIFVSVVLWVLRPGTRTLYEDSANIPFKHDEKDRAHG
jgi:cytochrome c oxidase cbb3-type subunit 4